MKQKREETEREKEVETKITTKRNRKSAYVIFLVVSEHVLITNIKE
jgi:hypothetical protein